MDLLNPIWPRGGGHYGPPYHESVCCCCMVRATLTKLPDFVPLYISQVPESQFWHLFFKKLKKLDIKNFWGSSSNKQKSEKIPHIVKLNLNYICSQLSLEVHYTLETQIFEIFEFLNFSNIISIKIFCPEKWKSGTYR